MIDITSKHGTTPAAAHSSPEVYGEDLKRILGDIDEWKIIAILALNPTLADIEEAFVWASGDGDVLAESGHPENDVVAQIVDILTADEEVLEAGSRPGGA